MLFDFGIDSQTTAVTGWNNFFGTGGSQPSITMNVKDTTGAFTGFTLAPTWSVFNSDTGVSGTAANYDGPYPAALSAIPQSALRDSVYVRDGETLKLVLNNLPANKYFNFQFYGAAGNTGDYSLFTVTGSTNGQDHIAPLVNNSSGVATINNIVPDGTQTIQILFEGRRADGSAQLPGVNDDALGRLNFLSITQYALPVGDYNHDTVVNGSDYDVWRANDGSTTSLNADGDHSGVVDAADYVLWRKAIGVGSGNGPGFLITPVPEPQSAALLLIAAGSLSGVILRAMRRPWPRR